MSSRITDGGEWAAPTFAGGCALFLFLSAYFLSYPLKVWFASETVEIIKPAFVGAAAILLVADMNIVRYLRGLRFNGWHLIGVASAILLVLLLQVNSTLFSDSESLRICLRKHLSYTVWLGIAFLFGRKMTITSNLAWTIGVSAWVVASVVAVVLNSILHQIPPGTVLLDKYYVGVFVRAGGGYLDPNFLSINMFFLARIIRRGVSSRLLTGVLLTGVVFCVMMTFSRAGMVLFAAFHFNDLRRLRISRGVKIALGLAVLTGVLLTIRSEGDLSFLFSRFSSEEGASSTSDRMHQYSAALGLISPEILVMHLVVGHGGLDFFYNVFGVHLHNYLLATYLDAGLAGMALVVVFVVCFLKGGGSVEARIMLVYAGIQLLFLPNQPDTLFLAASLTLIALENRKDELSSRGIQT